MMKVIGNAIVDESGRTLILRGCNLGGSSKLPVFPPEASVQGPRSLKNPETVSFVDRPFPVEEAEIHFKRLKNWGFTFLRFVITWEALEHTGPGIYDESYLAYLRKILLAAEKEGISVFLDPHQDVWSRWTGGDGAPAWTLEKLGMDLEKLDAAGAAVTIQQGKELPECGDYWKKDKSPRFFWPINYNRYAAATLFSLFFGGKTYAPELTIEGENVQDWFQERYIAAFRHCYRRLKNCKALAGWGVMNEPSPGFIGCQDLSIPKPGILPLGPAPTPWEAIRAASGEAVTVSRYVPWLKGPRKTGEAILNPSKVSVFREGFECPWKRAGVWTGGDSEKQLIKKNHFSLFNGSPPRFTEDFLKPFQRKFIERLKQAERPALFFIEGIAQAEHPSWSSTDGTDVVNAFHCYDGFTLYSKRFMPGFGFDETRGRLLLGRKKAAAYYAQRLAEAVTWTREHMENMPCLLGEFGLPFDLNNKKAFKTGDYSSHEKAFSRYYDAVDKALLHSTVWNYTADNTHKQGDHWNGEDFSIINNGEGRAKKGWLRPYPMASAGVPLEINWNRNTRVFTYQWRTDPTVKAPTAIFIPAAYFGPRLSLSVQSPEPGPARDILFEYKPKENILHLYTEEYDGILNLVISPERTEGTGKSVLQKEYPERDWSIQSGKVRLSGAGAS